MESKGQKLWSFANHGATVIVVIFSALAAVLAQVTGEPLNRSIFCGFRPGSIGRDARQSEYFSCKMNRAGSTGGLAYSIASSIARSMGRCYSR